MKFAFFLLIASLCAPPANADESTNQAIGIWLRDNNAARIRLAPCGVALCGTVVWMQDPRKDIYNPDEKERGKDLVGRRIFSGMMQDDAHRNTWKGSSYNPEDGRTYATTMVLNDAQLVTQECVTAGVICRSTNWVKVN
ncbi:MAG: DUF2147 domain-containing protein [Pseudomonadota bacterium]